MKNYTVLSAAGHVVCTGTCSEEDFAAQATEPGQRVVEGHLPFPASRPIASYRVKRAVAYPPLGDQIDAMYKLGVALRGRIEMPPETLTWLDTIAAVKGAHPKD